MQKVLVCLDTDTQPSLFDAVVAIDAGVDQLLRHGEVVPEQVESLVHGAMFTRGPAELKNTAIFIGGSDVVAAEELLAVTTKCFFDPLRVSVLLDPSGANTTAAAAVLAASRHVSPSGDRLATVLGTGSVGQRVASMLVGEGTHVRLVSRQWDRAEQICLALAEKVDGDRLSPQGLSESSLADVLEGASILIAAGPTGIRLVDAETLAGCDSLRAVVDLNAVPPAGIASVQPTDKGVERDGPTHSQWHYGALGVGSLKMKIHKAAIRRLFETNNLVLDAAAVLAIGRQINVD